MPPFVLATAQTNKSEALANYMRAICSGDYSGLPKSDGAHAVRWFARPRTLEKNETLDIDPGYADEAIKSFAIFQRLSDEGVILPQTRFQICLPTPTAICASYVSPRHAISVHRAFERALLREMHAIFTALPIERIAIQIDVCIEIMQEEGVYPVYFQDPFVGAIATIARMVDSVPTDAQVGFHFCYGDPGAKHFVEPADTAVIARFMKAIFAAVQRPIDWMHFPVPPERDDDGYFLPLRTVSLPDGMSLYAGLIHDHVSQPSNEDRVAAARRHLDDFGLATECGFGRRRPESVEDLLDLHARSVAKL